MIVRGVGKREGLGVLEILSEIIEEKPELAAFQVVLPSRALALLRVLSSCEGLQDRSLAVEYGVYAQDVSDGLVHFGQGGVTVVVLVYLRPEL